MFLPDGCSLRSLDPARFNDQMAGRRMIFLGDSLMRGNWQSLACWLADQVSMNPKIFADIDIREHCNPVDSHLADMVNTTEARGPHQSCSAAKLMHAAKILPAAPTKCQCRSSVACMQCLHACHPVADRAPLCFAETHTAGC